MNKIAKILLGILIINLITCIIPKNSAEAADDNQVTKVLLIGNSYTYYNDYGGMLAEMAKNKNKKMIVVVATHGGKDAIWFNDNFEKKAFSTYWWDNRTKTTELHLETGGVEKYTAKLSDIIKKDWGNLNRKNNWDYVILQNHQQDGTATGNVLIYNKVKDMISGPGNFVVLRTYTRRWDSHSNTSMKDSAKENGFSFIDIRKMANCYGDWKTQKTYLTIGDGAGTTNVFHPSGRGSYLFATAVYSRIFGQSDLASSAKATKFIKLYNSAKGCTKDFYTDAYYKTSINKIAEASSVTKDIAKELQSIVYENFEKCVINYEKNGWKKEDSKWYYYKAHEKQVGWLDIDDGVFYLNPERVTEWQTIDGEQYYFDKKTGNMCVGEKTIDKVHYYFDKDGKMLKNLKYGDYYYQDDGKGVKDKNAPKITVTKPTAWTNKDITVKIKVIEEESVLDKVTIDGKEIALKGDIYQFNVKRNNTFKVVATDIMGNSNTEKIKVTNIDKIAPKITGVKTGGNYKKSVTPKITEANLNTIKLYKNGKKVKNYKKGSKISEKGKYTLKVYDKAGNTTTVKFSII